MSYYRISDADLYDILAICKNDDRVLPKPYREVVSDVVTDDIETRNLLREMAVWYQDNPVPEIPSFVTRARELLGMKP